MKSKIKMKAIAAGVALAINPAFAAVHQVTSRFDGIPGSLRSIVAAAASGDSVTFAPWLHGKRLELDGPITIDKVLLIDGDIDEDNRSDITLDGQQKNRMFTVTSSGNLQLWSLHFENGKSADGGAIHNSGQVHIHYSVFNDNEADKGGAIFSNKTLLIETSTFKDNTAALNGGAVYAMQGQFINPPTTRTHKSTFARNWAHDKGGAIYNTGHFTAHTTTFSNNRAMKSLTSTSTRNKGGAVWTQTSGTSDKYTSEFYDCTLIGNKSHPMTATDQPDDTRRQQLNKHQNNGGTIYNFTLDRHAEITLKRTVIADSVGRNCGGNGHFIPDHVWSDDNTCSKFGEIGTDSGDPKLGGLTDNGGYTLTHMPNRGSGLIDAAGTTCMADDQRGAWRKNIGTLDTRCDIGAVERANQPPRLPSATAVNKAVPAEHEEVVVRKTTMTVLIQEKEALEYKKATLEGEKAILENEKITLKDEKAILEAEKATLQEQLASLQNQLAVVNAQLASHAATGEALRRLEAEAARLRTQITTHTENIASLQTEKEALQRQIETHRARIAQLEALDEMQLNIGDAGKIKRLTLNGHDVLYQAQTLVKTGNGNNDESGPLEKSTTQHIHEKPDGSLVSAGQLQGQNGLIYWRVASMAMPGTNFHIMHYEIWSASPFGDAAFGLYVDIDFNGNNAGNFDWLITGGTGHVSRLLQVDRANPTEGIAIGVRALKNASYIGWMGNPERYTPDGGRILNAATLTGADTRWGRFTPNQNLYPGATGYGPADVALTVGVRLKHSAKLASFEITVVGAPDGVIAD